MTLTPLQLSGACGCQMIVAENWVEPINAAMGVFAIDTPERAAAFLAQIGHESGRLRYTRELWGPTPAQLRYEGRADLGNTEKGDGYRFRGRGLIQTTGRANYRRTRDGLLGFLPLVPDFEATPEALEIPKWAAYSAAWFWADRGLNALADSQAFMQITRRINGGTNGYDDRVALWAGAQTALQGVA